MMNTKDKIKVMQAYVDGKVIECKRRCDMNWSEIKKPLWDWNRSYYRIKAEETNTPDSIDWSHVAFRWKYMARNLDGLVCFHETEPVIYQGYCFDSCESHVFAPRAFASYKQGTVDWKDSLVERPKD